MSEQTVFDGPDLWAMGLIGRVQGSITTGPVEDEPFWREWKRIRAQVVAEATAAERRRCAEIARTYHEIYAGGGVIAEAIAPPSGGQET